MPSRRTISACSSLILAITGIASHAGAQEATWTPAATQPAQGRAAVRTKIIHERWNANGVDVADTRFDTTLTLGLTPTVSLAATIPVVNRDDLGSTAGPAGGFDEAGLGDLSLELKWRFWQDDDPGVDTARLALLLGTTLPTGEGTLTSGSVNPSVGAVFTLVRGRHGFNQSAKYQFATGTENAPVRPGVGRADLVELSTAYLYRLAPERFTAETRGAWYATAELITDYETNGDLELSLAPSLLYEGRRFAAEAGVRLPIVMNVDHRAELEWGVIFGLRLLF